MKKILLGMVAILLVSSLAACNEEEAKTKEEDRVTSVETIEAEKGDLTMEESVYGRIQPGSSTPIMVENPGELDSLEAKNGDNVDKDEKIATIQSPAGSQTIKAQESGKVTNLNASEGEIVSNEEPLAVIIDTDTMKINFSVTAGMQKLLEKEDKLNTEIDGEKYKAEVLSIDSMPDETGMYTVAAELEEEDLDILPGSVAEVHIPEKRVKDAIILPTEAIVETSDETFIYVIKKDKAVKMEVKIKETQSDKTAIEGKVEDGDQVVTTGQLTLSDGDQVNVVKESGE